jgi:hypothetical protein
LCAPWIFSPSCQLRVKPRAQISRHDGAQIIPPPEYTIPNPRDQIIHRVAHRPWYHPQNRRQRPPSPTQSAKNVNGRIRPRKQRSFPGSHHNAVGQPNPLFRGHPLRERLSLQWRKSKCASRAIVPEHKLHRAMAQSTMAIVKEDFDLWHE